MPDDAQTFPFRQVDVFATEPLRGNPLAVVVGADALTDDEMARFANWTNLSETTFLLQPTTGEADYRVRIFTPAGELPFAGHPTLGSCHVWLTTGGIPRGDVITQECEIGLVRIRRTQERLAFAAPELRRSGAVEPAELDQVMKGLRLRADAVVDANWVDNGPGWIALLLRDRDDVLAIEPDYAALAGRSVGVVAPSGNGMDADFEIRSFTSGGYEDPVTGSLNAGIAQWLIGSGAAPASYVARQGTVLGRAGRVHVERDGDTIWIGGAVKTCIEGTVTI